MYHIMLTVFVDMHSIMCYLCIAIICWWAPVYSDTVACHLSDGHIGWWVGFWSGKYRKHISYIRYATNLLHYYINPGTRMIVGVVAGTCYLQLLRAAVYTLIQC